MLLAFRYQGRSKQGQRISGQVEALDRNHAEIQVRQLGLAEVVISRVPQKGESRWRGWWDRVGQATAGFWHPVNYRELSLWARSVQFTVRSGMNPFQAMSTIADGTRNPTLERITRAMGERALRGEPMSPALAAFPGVFPEYVRSLVEVGEESGALEATFGRLADYFEHTYELVLMAKKMTFYPKILLLAFFTIPQLPVLVLQGFETFLWAVWAGFWPVAAVVGGIWLGFKLCKLSDVLRSIGDQIKTKIPKIGQAFLKSSLARWGSAVSLLVNTGVPIHRAVVASASALANRPLERALLQHADMLLDGRPFSDVLRAARFPPELVEMVSIGDQTGNLSSALERVAGYYEQEARVGQKQLVTAMSVGVYLLVALAIGRYIISSWTGYLGGLQRFIP